MHNIKVRPFNPIGLINRTGIAGAVLQRASPLTDSFISLPFSSKYSKHRHFQTVRAGDLTIQENIKQPLCLMCHVPQVICHISHVMCPKSRVTCHMTSLLKNCESQDPEIYRKYPPPNLCHMSHVMCHVSHVTCHKSQNCFFFMTNWWSQLVQGLL